MTNEHTRQRDAARSSAEDDEDQTRRVPEEAEKPDANAVKQAEESDAHVRRHEDELGAKTDDVRHGFSQDSGYVQSGGTHTEPSPPDKK